MPDPTVTVHVSSTARLAVAAVKTRADVAPLPEVLEVNVVAPQLLLAVGVPGELMEVCGRTNVMVSPVSTTAFMANLYTTALDVTVAGLMKVS
jgi:hypothetical protein